MYYSYIVVNAGSSGVRMLLDSWFIFLFLAGWLEGMFLFLFLLLGVFSTIVLELFFYIQDLLL